MNFPTAPLDVADAPPAHGSMVGCIVERLREDILTRKFAPGARLVENDLTLRFAVSRGPVREALRRLAAEGLIVHLPNRGAVVRSLRRREIQELFEIRIELESLAARLAADADDVERRARFDSVIQPIFSEEARRGHAFVEENSVFHDAIVTLADNAYLRELCQRFQLPLLVAHAAGGFTPEVIDRSVREHRALALAIQARDRVAATAAVRVHLEHATALALAGASD